MVKSVGLHGRVKISESVQRTREDLLAVRERATMWFLVTAESSEESVEVDVSVRAEDGEVLLVACLRDETVGCQRRNRPDAPARASRGTRSARIVMVASIGNICAVGLWLRVRR